MTFPTNRSQKAIDAEWNARSLEFIEKAATKYRQLNDKAQSALQKARKIVSIEFRTLHSAIDLASIPVITAQVNAFCSDAEKNFNFSGCIPVLGSLSGMLRSLFGKLQILSGVALLALGEVGRFFVSLDIEEIESMEKWDIVSSLGKEYIMHGCLNVIRGNAETFAGAYTFGLGNLLFIIPNTINKRDFKPYFPYTGISPEISNQSVLVPPAGISLRTYLLTNTE